MVSSSTGTPAASSVTANRRPILVTGSHRSGTTWVGKILARAPGVGYIHEPFKPSVSRGILRKPFENWYHYLCAENEGDYPQVFGEVLKFNFSTRDEWRCVRNLSGALRLWRRWSRNRRMAGRECRPLIKDPLAVFSCEWLAQHFNATPVIIIRHPAAFASSLKVKNWGIHFRVLLQQPCLMRDHLEAFRPELEDQAARKPPIVERAALLWKCIYSVVHGFQARHPDWIFIRHEDVSRDPSRQFRELYAQLGLDFTPAVERYIDQTSGAHNPAERHSGGVRRDSVKNIQNWKKRLTAEEIECVRRGASPVWQKFYSDAEW